jgi:acetylornithine/N-succinyldiaminopimelate aminotransferase
MKLSNKQYHDLDQTYYLPTFKRYPIALEKGMGSRVWDVEGNEYIDVLAGIAVNNIGHCHPKHVKAIQEQASKLLHISNFYVSPPQVHLAEKLVRISGLNRVFFTNSGAESVEGAIKIARKYAHSLNRGGTIVSVKGSFHGRTMATIATGKAKMQKGFDPIPKGFRQIPFNDIEAAKSAVNHEVAAFLLEPIQGEGGINPADPTYLRELRALCDAHSIALIFDEVQCGIGRTGAWFAKDKYGIQPDIMTLAKGLGGGIPVGAVLSNEEVSSAIEFGDHGTTFGGNPLACAAALAVLEVIEDENLIEAAYKKGEWLRNEILNMGLPGLKEVRGMGLMIGLEFEMETPPLAREMLNHGILTNATAGNVIRLVPPLNIPVEDLRRVLQVLEKSIEKIYSHA